MLKAFKGTVHLFTLNGKERRVVDPRTIPSDIRDALCLRHDYRLPSIIGPNHDVAHYDLMRKDWRDMRHAEKTQTFYNQNLSFSDSDCLIFWT